MATPLARRLTTAATSRAIALVRRRWLAGAALLVGPKCVLCLVAYTGIAVSFGWTGPELCGETKADHLPIVMVLTVAAVAVAAVHDRRARKAGRS